MDRQHQVPWWLDDVSTWQLTVRSILAGAILGGLLSLTNLYVSAKAGATFGMGTTASLLAFLFFRCLCPHRARKPFGILENNMVQTVAGAAGYMASALTSSFAAYLALAGRIPPWWQGSLWAMALAALGLILAIPFKRHFVNDLQFPFPEGQACAVILATLHNHPIAAIDPARSNAASPDQPPATDDRGSPWQHATLLVTCVAMGAIVKLLQSSALLAKARLGFLHIPEALDDWYYRLAERWQWWIPEIAGISWRELTIRPTLDVAMFAVGGLMGIRLGASLLLGAAINYLVLAPWMVAQGDIATSLHGQVVSVGFRAISAWSLWPGVAMIMAASLTPFLVRLRASVLAMRSLSIRLKNQGHRPMGDQDISHRWFWSGLLACGALIAWMAAAFWGVSSMLVVLTLPLAIVLTVLGIHATALTSITPAGAMARVSQLAAGFLAPGQPTANVMLGAITADATLHASAFCQHLRPGYLLGASPTRQAVGHLVGILAGTAGCIPVFYLIFLQGNATAMVSSEYPFPAAAVWMGVARMLTSESGGVPGTAVMAATLAGLLGCVLSLPLAPMQRLPLSPVGIGLAFLIPFDISLAIFAGGLCFWLAAPNSARASGRVSAIRSLITEGRESICAGLMTGTALAGIIVMGWFTAGS